MLKIGAFSKLSKISIRMLRYYDELGLLTPCATDSFTGYRYYSAWIEVWADEGRGPDIPARLPAAQNCADHKAASRFFASIMRLAPSKNK